ncbi:MAG: 30S ribosomal protein S20 [Bacteroidales bacterium]|jgi:small subunit ribosomal protein S20|nr:30S ribosomal protein S20 [Bacteroidales bacterium]
MANHKSSLKRIRQTSKRRLHNRYYAKSMRNQVRKFRTITDKSEAEGKLPMMCSIIDKLAKRGIIHKNKAGNLKSKLAKYTAKLA